MQNTTYDILYTDVLVIGGGGAGLRAAIEAAKQKVKVLIVIKEPLGEAHTKMAAGGVNVAIKAPATPKQHFDDTIKGGWFINNYKLVDIFSKEMPDRVYDLESYGVKFDRLPDGSYYTWAGGKHSAPLNLSAGDYTGREMMQGLTAEVKKLKIPSLPNHFVTKLLTTSNRHSGKPKAHPESQDGSWTSQDDKKVIGAFLLDQKTGKYKVILAKATIVAAGGAGQMYEITTNAPSNSGEGYAWGLDVGAFMQDMEFVQFHPTGMVYPEKLRGTLVTEKTRGHDGRLINSKGERFMTRYQPERMELAGRDEVARAIYQEIQEGRGTEHGGVYLDTTHWEKGVVEKQIPEVFQTHMKAGIDIRKTRMQIAPSMHHMMGGFKINEWGETNVKGLFATGEVTVSIHGANRLGGNSLAEGQVFGRRTGMKAAEYSKNIQSVILGSEATPGSDSGQARMTIEIINEIKRIESLKKKSGIKPKALRAKLKKLMWNYAGIIRDEKGLKKGLSELKDLQASSQQLVASSLKELQEALETIEMLKVAEMVLVAALERKETRGAHFRSDYPKMDEKWEKNIVLENKNGKITTRVVPVIK